MLDALKRLFIPPRPVVAVAPYLYVDNPRDIGVGVANLAPVQPGLAYSADQYAPRYNIRRNMEILEGGYGAPIPSYPETDLRANGVYLSGDIALASLVEFESARENQK